MSSPAAAPSITQEQLCSIALWEDGLLKLHTSILARVAEGEDIEEGKYSIDMQRLESAARRAPTFEAGPKDVSALRRLMCWLRLRV